MSPGGWQKQLNAITLFVEDLPLAKAFYADVFEQPLVFEDASSAVFKFANTMINLLASPDGDDLIAPAAVAGAGTGSRCQLSIFVDDVDTVCAELETKGVELVNGPIDGRGGCARRVSRTPQATCGRCQVPSQTVHSRNQRATASVRAEQPRSTDPTPAGSSLRTGQERAKVTGRGTIRPPTAFGGGVDLRRPSPRPADRSA